MACICVAPAICVSLSGATVCAQVCMCVCACVTELLHAATSCEVVFSCPGCALRLSPSVSYVCVCLSTCVSACMCVRVCVLFSKDTMFAHAHVLFVWPCMFQLAPLSLCVDPTQWIWAHFSFTLMLFILSPLPGDSNRSLMLQCALLSYSLSVSTCHWALCFISSGGEPNKGY